ncbi:MAG: hypothetical protein EP330_02820 [Deltaproteobacteria bacterium]|nr:MAG: hypothetical protein EP330_02820 [Deltaproteobacteria bacterium]
MRITVLTAAILATLTACGSAELQGDTATFDGPVADPALNMLRDDGAAAGELVMDDGSSVMFTANHDNGLSLIIVELNGMRLTAEKDRAGVRYDGRSIADNSPALMTDLDRAALMRLTTALEAEFYPSVAHATSKEEYRAIRPELSDAEQLLFSAVEGIWTQWPSSQPLAYEIDLATTPRSGQSSRRYATPKYVVYGEHDCNSCDFGDEDCGEYKELGRYFDGANHGNCGTSDYGTQYTWDCTNHDQCVRTSKHGGHVLLSLYCDDQFLSCTDDELLAPSCEFDMRTYDGGQYDGNCPTEWNGDGQCDCFCQFDDVDCAETTW